MLTRAAILTEARSWIGTPWQHQGRLKGVAADCAGMVIEVGKTCGCVPDDGTGDRTDYSMAADPVRMKAALDLMFDRIFLTELKPADILWMKGGIHPQHIGIYTERGTLIHAMLGKGVEELGVEYVQRNKLVGAYRYRNIGEID